MSRSGYSDGFDYNNWATICWRGAVASAVKGKRGQDFLKEMLTTLDAMSEKRLINGKLEESGQVCAIGSVGKARGIDMTELDENDETGYQEETPEQRFIRVRAWVAANIVVGVAA